MLYTGLYPLGPQLNPYTGLPLFPTTSAGVQAGLGLTPTSIWAFQGAGPGVPDELGAYDTTQIKTPLYEQPGPGSRLSVRIPTGNDHKLTTGSTVINDNTGSWAMLCVLHVGQSPGYTTSLISKQNTSSTVSAGWRVRQLSTHKLQLIAGTGAAAAAVSPSTVFGVASTTWRHVIFGYDATASQIFWIDDTDGKLTAAHSGVTSTSDFMFGGHNFFATESNWTYAVAIAGSQAESLSISTISDLKAICPV